MDYTQLQSQIISVIKQLGQTVKIQHAIGGSSVTQGVWSTSEDKDLNQQNPSQITQTERVMYINTPKKVPQVGDILIVNAKEYAIATVQPYAPTNLVIAYKLGVEN